MRNAIQYYYGIEVDSLNYEDGKYYFENYLLYPIYKEINESLYKYMKKINHNNYEIVINKENKIITTINSQNYILLKKNIKFPLSYLSLEKNTICLQNKQILAWDTLWENKIDYYEKHVKTLSSIKIKESFHYYIGLSENAISLYKQFKKEEFVYLAHLRLNRVDDYLNPINYIIDYRSRDVAEYTKKLFFENKLDINDIFLYLKENYFSSYECILFFIRLLFPSYYFDSYDLIAQGQDDNLLDKYIAKIDEYEIFLNSVYSYLRTYINIPKIEWLIKKYN